MPKLSREERPIVVMHAGGALGAIVVNGLSRCVGPVTVIEEPPEGRAVIIRRRVRLCGVTSTLGQIAFGLYQMASTSRHRSRLEAIWRSQDLDPQLDPALPRYCVPSVNSEECRALLQRLQPAVVAVYGTRIIGAKTLGCIDAPFINYHAGINPKYRGQHPGYWARASGDDGNCGVTIHLVDRGVDTGQVLYQAHVTLDVDDNIATCQHVQAATAIPLLARAIGDAIAGKLQPRTIDLPSRLWFPPTLWAYIAIGLRRGVW